MRSVPRTALVQRLEAEVSELQRRLSEAQGDLAEASGETLAADHSSDPVILDSFLREDLGEMPWLVPGLLAEGSVAIMVAHGGVGKAQPIDEPVLTPAGWCEIGKLAVGDRVIDPESGLTQVVAGVFPRGVREVFRVTMKDGGSTRCCGEHLWRAKQRESWGRLGPWKTVETRSMMSTLKADDGERFWSIPWTSPVEYASPIHLPIDPYALGAYLGDGTSNGSVSLHDVDEDVIARFSASLPAGDVAVTRGERLGVRVKKASGKRGVGGRSQSGFKRALADLGIDGARSWEKKIPELYERLSIVDRVALLQGLLDTDGYADGASIEYSTASGVLAGQVIQIVRSLGGKVHETRREVAYKLNGLRHGCRDSYRINITFPDNGIVPVSSSKHLAKWKPAEHSRRFIDSIEPDGTAETVCIQVSGSGLYVTRDWIVTHNTTLITQLALSLAAGVHVAALDARILEPCPVLYVAAEGARIAFRSRVETARQSLGIRAGGTRWFIQPRDLSDYLIGSRGLERLIVKSGCRLAILDTLGYFWKGDRNSDTDWKERVMQPLRALIGRTGAAFLLVHHLGKGDDWKGRGTSAMFDDSDLFLQMEPGENATPGNADQPVRLWVRKNKYAPSNYYFDLVYRTESAIFDKGV